MMSGWLGMGLTGFFFMTFFLVAAIALIALAVRDPATRPGTPEYRSGSAHESANDVLKARYARGEIEREQYEQMQHDLAA